MSRLLPVLTRFWDQSKPWRIDTYRQNGGYKSMLKAFKMSTVDIISEIKNSNLRGRGGAGFPTHIKWSSVASSKNKTRYVVINADESEPGTCKDMPIMFFNPHELIEGIIITSYAVGANKAFIYIRGEVLHIIRRIQNALLECYKNKILGLNILNSGFNLDIILHVGAGAYICGEETALLNSLEGYRGTPRFKIPFPVVSGLYKSPTVINNVETIASVPSIIQYGSNWFKSLGSEKSSGFVLYSVSGHVKYPGQFEGPLGLTLRELLQYCKGIRNNNKLKFWTPGGSSTPLLTDEHIDIKLTYEDIANVGSMLGTRAIQIFDNTTCVVRAVLRWMEFYKHESCGKCTPCREGTYWIVEIMRRIEEGKGMMEDLEKLESISNNIFGNVFCALGDGATSPVLSSLEFFKEEYIEHINIKKCMFNMQDSNIFKNII